MTRAERRSHWRSIIDNQLTSGMCIADYCRDIQINRSHFYTWRRRLREQQPSAGSDFLELIPSRVTETASGIHIHLGAKLAIEVERGFDPPTLRAVVETLCANRCSA